MNNNNQSNKYFNINASHDMKDRQVFEQNNTTNFLDVTQVKYLWANNLWDTILINFWHENKYDFEVDMNNLHKINYQCEEYKLFVHVISGLQYLDSVQVQNLPNLSESISAPEIKLLLAGQNFQEAIHVKTYSKIMKSLINHKDYNNYITHWKLNNNLKQRNILLTNILDKFFYSPNSKFNFICALLATYALEGISFYSSFALIFEIAAQTQYFHQAADAIRAISHDEMKHVEVDGLIYKEVYNEINNEDNINFDDIKKFTHEFFLQVAQREKDLLDEYFSEYNMSFSTLTKKDLYDYIEYLTDLRLLDIKIPAIYQKDVTTINQLKEPKTLDYISQISGFDKNAVMKHNFFEKLTDQYIRADVISGWDEIENYDFDFDKK